MTLEAPLWIQLGTFSSQNDRLLIDTLLTDGVSDGRADPVAVLPASPDLAVTANGSTLSVDVAPGVCVVTGTDQTRQGKYVCRNTASVNVALTARPASGLTRLDLIYAQVKDSSSGIVIPPGTDGWVIDKVTGTPSGSSPTLPAVPASALALAQVRVANAGGATLTGADVTDLRHRAITRGAPIGKRWNAVTAAASADDYFAQGGPRSIPGAQVSITTYTPNVDVTMYGHVSVHTTAVNHACTTWPEVLLGTSSVLWDAPQQSAIFVNNAFLADEGNFMYVYRIANPGSYTARIVGQASQSQNVTVQAAGSWITCQWSDIASATG